MKLAASPPFLRTSRWLSLAEELKNAHAIIKKTPQEIRGVFF
jgi:hypothetical protein